MSKKEEPKRVDNSYSENILDDLLNDLSSAKDTVKVPTEPEKAKAPKPKEEKPAEQLHSGHRERIRQKFANNMSFDGLSEHEVLELLLYYCIPRHDLNGLAHELIHKFGSFSGVLNAPFEDLAICKGLNEQSALYIKILMRLCAKYNVEMQRSVYVSNAEALEDYMIFQFSGETEECAKLFFVDSRGKLSAPHEIGRGLENRSVFDFKKAMNLILSSPSKVIIIAHSHINGSAKPSENDVVITRRFRQMLEPIGVELLEHFIVYSNEVTSMRASGLMDI